MIDLSKVNWERLLDGVTWIGESTIEARRAGTQSAVGLVVLALGIIVGLGQIVMDAFALSGLDLRWLAALMSGAGTALAIAAQLGLVRATNNAAKTRADVAKATLREATQEALSADATRLETSRARAHEAAAALRLKHHDPLDLEPTIHDPATDTIAGSKPKD